MPLITFTSLLVFVLFPSVVISQISLRFIHNFSRVLEHIHYKRTELLILCLYCAVFLRAYFSRLAAYCWRHIVWSIQILTVYCAGV